jgi:hypothetical protein
MNAVIEDIIGLEGGICHPARYNEGECIVKYPSVAMKMAVRRGEGQRLCSSHFLLGTRSTETQGRRENSGGQRGYPSYRSRPEERIGLGMKAWRTEERKERRTEGH